MKIDFVDNVLVIRIDVTKERVANALPSKSGKTKVLDTTHGFTSVQTPHGAVSLSLNATVR